VIDGVTSEGFALDHVHELGWMEAPAYTATARTALEQAVIAPLREFGIHVPTR
jgi:hypothetical protein